MSEHDRNSTNGDPREAGLARLYREAAGENPPPHLDAAILAAARREVGARPRPLGASRLSRWRLPLALAAVVVLSVSLVTVMMEEGGEDLSAPPPRAVAPRSAEPEAARKESVMAKPGEGAAAGRAAEAPAAASKRALERIPAVKQEFETGQRAELKAADEPVSEALSKSVPAAPPPGIGSGEAAPSRRRAFTERDEAPARPAPQSRAAPAGVGRADQMQPEALADEAREAAGARQASPVMAREIRALADEPPAKWLERIAALRLEGRGAEADELLAEFRRRFPLQPVPEK